VSSEEHRLRYDVAPGRSVQARVFDDRIKLDTVFATAAAASSEVVYDLRVDGAVPRARADGGVEFLRGNTVVGAIPDGFAVDSSGDRVTGAPPAVTAVRVSLSAGPGSTWRVVESVDRAWLDAAERQYPVRVDPSLTFDTDTSQFRDAFVGDGCLDCNYSGFDDDGAYQRSQVSIDGDTYVEKVGKIFDGGAWEYYSYERFDTTPILRHPVASATWNGLLNPFVYPINTLSLWTANNTWADSSLTWRNQPGHTAQRSFIPLNGQTDVHADVTTQMQRWADGDPNFGFSVDTAGANFWAELLSDEQGLAYAPYIEATIDNQAPGWTPLTASPPTGASTADLTPVFDVNSAIDPEGDPFMYEFELYSASGVEIYSNEQAPSGSAPSWELPPDLAMDGSSYQWRVVATDRFGTFTATPMSTVTVNTRLGAQASSAYDSVGAVSVNLVNGNVRAGAATPGVNTVAGSMGVGVAYDSQRSPFGLTGGYFKNCTNPALPLPATPTLERKLGRADLGQLQVGRKP
jgi:hypothetical protein